MDKVGIGIELIVEQEHASAMAEAIRNTQFGKVRGSSGEDGRYVAIVYFSKVAAEAATQPCCRTPLNMCPNRL